MHIEYVIQIKTTNLALDFTISKKWSGKSALWR